jgi:hypothetical protein
LKYAALTCQSREQLFDQLKSEETLHKITEPTLTSNKRELCSRQRECLWNLTLSSGRQGMLWFKAKERERDKIDMEATTYFDVQEVPDIE